MWSALSPTHVASTHGGIGLRSAIMLPTKTSHSPAMYALVRTTVPGSTAASSCYERRGVVTDSPMQSQRTGCMGGVTLIDISVGDELTLHFEISAL